MKWLIIILMIFVSHWCIAQDSIGKKSKWELNGYVKIMESVYFDKNLDNPVTGSLIHNRLNVKWKPTSNITAAAEFRNRLFWGEQVRNISDPAEYLKNENEKVNLQKTIIFNESLVFHTNVERLYFDYKETDVSMRIGRQRINWGVATTWNPNDIFNSYNFLDFDYEERPGVDGAKLHYVFGNSFSGELAYAHSGKEGGDVAAMKYALNKWNYDVQFIAGWYKAHPTIGAGWAGYVNEAGFKGEVQYYFGFKDSADHLNVSLESDYMFKKGLYLDFGFLYNKQGLYKPVSNWDTVNFTLSPENLMPTKWNFIVTTSKQCNALLSVNMSVVYAPGTNLFILYPSLSYNLATNFDLSFVWQSFFAEVKSSFEAVNHQGFLRLKWSF